jgi:hypothetical protein
MQAAAGRRHFYSERFGGVTLSIWFCSSQHSAITLTVVQPSSCRSSSAGDAQRVEATAAAVALAVALMTAVAVAEICIGTVETWQQRPVLFAAAASNAVILCVTTSVIVKHHTTLLFHVIVCCCCCC